MHASPGSSFGQGTSYGDTGRNSLPPQRTLAIVVRGSARDAMLVVPLYGHALRVGSYRSVEVLARMSAWPA